MGGIFMESSGMSEMRAKAAVQPEDESKSRQTSTMEAVIRWASLNLLSKGSRLIVARQPAQFSASISRLRE
jgi:hypothetical protein